MSQHIPSTKELYLQDLCILLKKMALDAREQTQKKSDDERAYSLGRSMAFCEVISLMQQQAQAFGIELKELGLDDIRPEHDLI